LRFPYFSQFFPYGEQERITKVYLKSINLSMVGANRDTQTDSWQVEITAKDEADFEYRCSRPVKGDSLVLTSESSYENISDAQKEAEETISRFGND
jgi:hypothetical protein